MLQWLLRFGSVPLFPDALVYAVLGGVVGWLLVLVWWAFFSGAPLFERCAAPVVMALALLLTYRTADVSIATGMMGLMLLVYATPVLSLTFVLWALLTTRLSPTLRRTTMVATIFLTAAAFNLLRTNGITAGASADFAWRWQPTAEALLLVAPAAPVAPAVTVTPTPAVIPVNPNHWPGFRGPARNGVVPANRINTNWAKSAPTALWRKPIGPGWSSFAVAGDLFYTQEQRGEDEIVACYRLSTGEPVWQHRDPARFWESNAGAGPRSTPTLSGGRLYTLGATGLLNALNPATGKAYWSRNAAADHQIKLPGWGFSSSPVVVDDVVIIALAGTLAGYDKQTGQPRWLGPAGGGGYSSPHVVTLQSVPQVLLLGAKSIVALSPATGAKLWDHPLPDGARIVQPALTAEGDIIVNDGDSQPIRRLAVSLSNDQWQVQERWVSSGLKPYFNDFVIHQGHAYGFDGRILSCVNLEDGQRKWKGGRYGNGQLLLLPDQNLLLVLSEEGELALISATPDQFTEIARAPAIEGKTWNHPVLVGDTLLVRNGEHMAAFRLAR